VVGLVAGHQTLRREEEEERMATVDKAPA